MTPATPSTQAPSVIVMYGSQTGNCEAIASQICSTGISKGFPMVLVNMKDFREMAPPLEQQKFLIVVVSSHGDGDAPDNATRFWTFIRRRSQPNDLFASLKYTVLGLGDSNYTRYMEVPRFFDRRFSELGATRFNRYGEADDATGLEDQVEPWIRALWQSLEKCLSTNMDTFLDSKLVSIEKNFTNLAIESSDKKISENLAITASSNVPATKSPPRLKVSNNTSGMTNRKSGSTPNLKERTMTVEFECNTLNTSSFLKSLNNTVGTTNGEDLTAPISCPVSAARLLTVISDPRSPEKCSELGEKVVWHLEVNIDLKGFSSFVPGDSFGVWCENPDDIVLLLASRLYQNYNIEQQVISLRHINGDNIVKLSQVPYFYTFPCTIKNALSRYFDITSPPKKLFLRMLAEYCKDEREKMALFELSSRSKAGLATFSLLFDIHRCNLLDILYLFSSCQPDVGHVFEMLPTMRPRFYSITTSPLTHPKSLHAAFSLVSDKLPQLPSTENILKWLLDPETERAIPTELNSDNENPRFFRGVCTHWLSDICKTLNEEILIFIKRGKAFSLPVNVAAPIVMIGPGTGVAPFRGFILHRRMQLILANAFGDPDDDADCGVWRGMEVDPDDPFSLTPSGGNSPHKTPTFGHANSSSLSPALSAAKPTLLTSNLDLKNSLDLVQRSDQKSPLNKREKQADDIKFGPMVLFFGCRDTNGMLYSNDFQQATSDGTLSHYSISYSRMKDKPKLYVQDRIEEDSNARMIYKMIALEKGYIFICGDGAAMVKGVSEALCRIWIKYGEMNEESAKLCFINLMKEERYVLDVWS